MLANPFARPSQWNQLDGWTLYRLRHSSLTHDVAEWLSLRVQPPDHSSRRSSRAVRRRGFTEMFSVSLRSSMMTAMSAIQPAW